jgi:2-hydroxy-3-oxopropionate reductase
MGSRMGPHLLRAGFPLTVCDLEAERVRLLERVGAVGAASPREVAARSDLTITMLPSLAAIERVVLGPDGLIEGAAPGTVVIDMSTSLPSLSQRLAAALAERDVAMLDAPVSGTTPAAESATLVAMVGGDPAVLARCRPVLETLCSRIFHCGGAGRGNAMKLALNLLVYVPTIAGFEAMALAARMGLDPATLVEVIGSGSADSYIVKYKLGKALQHDYEPGGSVDVAVKDLELAIQMAQENGVPLLLPPIALQSFLFASQAGLGEKDTAILLERYARLLGLEIDGGTS